ncbi:hypothetical protein OG625_01725 [Streptomyces sp. NBC_01351]|uniref:hypothetical protein n=1 Tax=Streptomyces sp. NBC_01351 TaxID=2903833 RepID=UPI002E334995|nr:hypothetical protein [Streptomyces sp. NBC_01351]
MPDAYDQDPLRSLFRQAASAGRSEAALAPVSVIARRGERARRRRIAGIALACCLVLAGSGAAVAAFLPQGAGPTLPATTPPPPAPSPAPTETRPPTTRPPVGPPPSGTAEPGASATATATATATQAP